MGKIAEMVKVGETASVTEVEGGAAGCCGPAAPGAGAETAGTDEQVRLMSALSDGTRLRIVTMLARRDEPLCVCEIQERFELGQPTISHHLRVLREARLVTWEKRGLWVYYSLDRATLGQAARYLSGLLALPALPALPVG